MPALVGKVVIVTGAGRGIGREIALYAAAEGASVVVNDPGVGADGRGGDEDPAAQVVTEIEAAGGHAVASLESVASWAGAQAIVATALDAFGRLDALVNNAGILRDRIFHRMDEDDFDSVVKIHLYGSFFVARAAASVFREQESGAYVHMTSTSGLIGNFGQANYAAAKLGIVGLSRSIALDMARFNVRSNCVAPFAWSRMTATIPVGADSDATRVDNLRQLAPAKVAPLSVFLASELSAPMTGQILGVRANEVYLFSQPRPVRSIHRSDGWTLTSLAQQLMPALAPSFVPIDRSQDVFSWDPI
jgi:NAD(P)-dependent dehydrogenase (short-subunit alcohol dehydrogenase family)